MAVPFATERVNSRRNFKASSGNSEFLCDESEAAGALSRKSDFSGPVRRENLVEAVPWMFVRWNERSVKYLFLRRDKIIY